MNLQRSVATNRLKFIQINLKFMADRNVRIIKTPGRKPNSQKYPKAASVEFDKNSLVEFAAGYLGVSDDDDTVVFGIITQEIASTDDDYTSATPVDVEVIRPGDEVEMTTTAELTVGTSYGISNAYTVDQSDTSNDVFTCVKVISSTRAIGIMQNVIGNGVI